MVLAEQQKACKTFQIIPGYILRSLADEYLAVPVALERTAQSQVAILNETGSILWEQLEEKRTIADLLTIMTERFDVSEEEAEADILEFLKYLEEHKLIVTEEIQ